MPPVKCFVGFERSSHRNTEVGQRKIAYAASVELWGSRVRRKEDCVGNDAGVEEDSGYDEAVAKEDRVCDEIEAM